MLDDRKEKVHNIVEVGLGIITHHHKLAAEGKMSEAKPRRLPAMRCAACASPPATTTSASTPTGSITCMVATRPGRASQAGPEGHQRQVPDQGTDRRSPGRWRFRRILVPACRPAGCRAETFLRRPVRTVELGDRHRHLHRRHRA
jgi:hypothetical protein